MKRLFAPSCLALGLLAGCPAPADVYEGDFVVQGPVVSEGRLVWTLGAARTVVTLDPTRAEAPEVRRLAFTPRALAAAGERVLATGVVDDEARFVVLEADEDVEVPLPARFDRILPAPSGRFAVLLDDPLRGPDAATGLTRDANEIAIVDLERRAAETVDLATESVAPRAVVFGPQDRAAVVLDAAVVVLDLAAPERRLTLPLRLGADDPLRPEQVVFSPDGRHVFVRATGTPDVVALTLTEADGGLDGRVNLLFAPGALRLWDLVVLDAPGFEASVVGVFEAAQGSLLAHLLVDGRAATVRAVAVDVRALEDLGGGRVLAHAAIGDTAGGDALVGWSALDDRVDVERLAGPPSGAPRVAGGVAFFGHAAQGRDALTVVSVADASPAVRVDLRPLLVEGQPRGVAVAGDRVVLAADVAREGSGAAPAYAGADPDRTGVLAVLDAAGAPLGGLTLDDPVVAVGVVGDHLYAVHPDAFGDVTVVPRDDPSRAAARRWDGLFVNGLLDAADEEFD